MTKTKKSLKLIGKILFFLILTGLVLGVNLPMQIYAYDLSDLLRGDIWKVIYILMILLIIFIVRRLDKSRRKFSGAWYEKRKSIDSNWIIKLVVFILIFAISNYIEGYLVERMELGEAFNQEVVEAELNDFPLKSWLYLQIVVIAPVLEELVFRKAFMDLFFTKDKALHNFLAVFISGLFFGLLHEASFSWYLFLYSVSGWLLALFYRTSRDIRFPICVHIANNLLSVVVSVLV